MRTDREALIAGIAADSHNDLRKLVCCSCGILPFRDCIVRLFGDREGIDEKHGNTFWRVLPPPAD